MKRKTNLFYLNGPDSKFITFSNYTEVLTGNFLSTDIKLFPSRFICINLKGLNNTNKEALIKYLVEYYESKLSVLRDNIDKPDNNISPLNYLLEALCKIESIDDDSIEISDKDLFSIKSNNLFNIPYISDITEQDYNGTFTDIICMINLNNVYSGEILYKNITSNENNVSVEIPKYFENNERCLYGWENGIVTDYINSKSLFDREEDDKGIYYLDSIISYIRYLNKKDISTLEFNMIIPLFDIVNINYKSNTNNIEDDKIIINDKEYNGLNLTSSNSNNLYIKNVPLGIWFSGDNPIIINKDIDSGFSENWSLSISSQFKPFPYSKSIPNEINNSIVGNSFSTFSQILCQQNNIIKSFNNIINNINNINDRITNIESKLNNIGTTDNIDSLRKEMVDFENEVNDKILDSEKNILSYFDNLKWKSSI